MVFKVDESVPADSVDYHWSKTTYDGAPDSLVPEIPAHWHKHHDEYMVCSRGLESSPLLRQSRHMRHVLTGSALVFIASLQRPYRLHAGWQGGHGNAE